MVFVLVFLQITRVSAIYRYASVTAHSVTSLKARNREVLKLQLRISNNGVKLVERGISIDG